MNAGWSWINGQERAAENPLTFRRPPLEAIQRLTPGDYVKIGVETLLEPKEPINAERFWVKLTVVTKDCLAGVVEQSDMQLHKRHWVEDASYIRFGPEHVLDIQWAAGMELSE